MHRSVSVIGEMPTQRRRLAGKLVTVPRLILWLAGGTILSTGCDRARPTETSDIRAPGTIRMARMLDSIASARDSEPDEYNNDARASRLAARPIEPDLDARLRHRGELGLELLKAGRIEEAIRQFQTALEEGRQYSAVNPKYLQYTRMQIAISHLRIGELENCIDDNNSDRCLLPISREGIHERQRGSREAIETLSEALRHDPNDLIARWLLNIAYMTLGEHPRGVPAEWLIPPSAFESEYDITHFPNVAPQLGLAVSGHAGGAIIEDFDGDGYLDVMASSDQIRDQIRFFRNLGNGEFVERTKEAGLLGITSGLNLNHADFDNDGFPDVLVQRGGWHPNPVPLSLLRNRGDGTFEDVTFSAGLGDLISSQAAAWADFDNDGWLDLFVGSENRPSTWIPSRLYRNNRNGTFTNVASQVGLDVLVFVKGAAWGDYDNDGRPDLYISQITRSNMLFHNDGPDAECNWRFSRVPNDGRMGEPKTSFPVWFFDYDNDGSEDVFVSGWGATAGDIAAEYLGIEHRAVLPKLYRNDGRGNFTDVTEDVKLNRVMLAMGANFGDLDNDGWLDFYVGTGNPDFETLIPNRMFRNNAGKTFQDVTTSGGFGHLQKGHGVAWGDLDNDGDQDIYAVIGGAYEADVAENVLFANPGHGNHWITIKLEGVRSNRSAIGARIKVTVKTPTGSRDIHRTVGTGGSFGSSSLQQEIGLGDAKSITNIAVTWPTTGLTDNYRGVELDQIVRIREGDPDVATVLVKKFDLTYVKNKPIKRPPDHGGHSAASGN